MQVHDIIHGFEVLRARKSAELNGTLWELRHIETGAQLIWMENGEENKLFSVAFKTLPSDDTGVFHILEHSVLGGSDRYPVKEPFLDLLKGSLNTFLNAMTFSDKTMYPVSSRNEEDFMNLTHVYLDAVFSPAIRHNPNIFRQEGWHYELRAGDEAPVYKGVVFNEMKGAFASVDELVETELCRGLFPDNCYRFVSGGDPEHIPELTEENFLNAYQTYYHPSNARFWLDGAVPLERVLRLIDEEYLRGRGAGQPVPDIAPQTPVAACRREMAYEIGAEEEDTQKAHIALGRIVCGWQDRKKALAFSLLGDYLTDSNESPLKRAILQSGLAQDVSLSLTDDVLQPYSTLHIRNTEGRHAPALRQIIRETAEGLLRDGLDREELAACLNHMAFQLRENREPQGLIRNITALTSWLHGGDPMQYLECEQVLAELRAALDTDYYESLLREMLLDDAHTVEVVLLPSRTRGEEKRQAEQARLLAAQQAWTKEQREELIAQNAALDAWHDAPDTPEALASLPMLSLSDVSDAPQWIETRERTHAGVTLLYHPIESHGISHVHLCFDVSDQPLEALPGLAFAISLLGQLPTRNYSVLQLQRALKTHVGHLSFGLDFSAKPGQTQECRAFVTAELSALTDELPQALRLTAEILTNTRYDEAGLMRELLDQNAEGMYRSILRNGHRVAMGRASSCFTVADAAGEKAGGYDYYRYLSELRASFDDRLPALRAQAEAAQAELFTSARLLISETASTAHDEVLTIIDLLPRGTALPQGTALRVALPAPAHEAITIPAGVSFAASASHLARFGQPYCGALRVLCGLLTYGYLWNEVRVKGGAYGCGFRAGLGGSLAYYSFRDPSPAQSLRVFADTPAFIRAFVESGEPLERYIISSIGADEPLLGPDALGRVADQRYLCGITYEELLRLRREELALTSDDLLALIPLFERLPTDSAACVVGSEAALKQLPEDWQRYGL